MVKYVNPRNGKAWQTSREDIEPAGFINVLALKEGDTIDCYYEREADWKKMRNGLYLHDGTIYAMGAPPQRRRRKRHRNRTRRRQ